VPVSAFHLKGKISSQKNGRIFASAFRDKNHKIEFRSENNAACLWNRLVPGLASLHWSCNWMDSCYTTSPPMYETLDEIML